MCDIGTINVRFCLLEIPYPYGYCRITLELIVSKSKELNFKVLKSNKLNLIFSKVNP
jgi:hypothetical protein